MAETDVVAFRFEAVNQAVAVQAFERISAKTLETEKRMESFDKSVRRSDDTFKNMNLGASKAAKALGLFSMAARGAGDEFGKFGSAALRVSETIMSFGTYLGAGGPWGIAIGVAVGAVTLLSNAFGNANDKAETLEETLANIGSNKTARQIAISAQAAAGQDAAHIRGLREAGFFESVAGPSAHTRATLEDVNALEKAAEERGQIFERINKGGKGAAGPGVLGGGISFEEEQRLKALSDASAERLARYSKIGDFRKAPEADAETQNKLSAQFRDERLKTARDTAAELEKINHDHLDRMQKMEEESATQRKQVAFGAISAVANATGNALHEAIKGHKMSARAIASSIGDALWADGMANLLKAGAMAFIPGFQGNAGGLAGAAAAEIAFAGVLGAATAGSGGGRGGAATGPHAARGESGGDYLSRTRADSPNARARASGYGGGAPVIVNYSPTFSPTDEDVRRLRKINDHASRFAV